MNHKLLLVKSITLLYLESQIPGGTERSNKLVRNVVSTVKISPQQLTLNTETEVLDGLRSLALEMSEDPIDHEYDIPGLVQRVKIVAGDDTTTFDALNDVIKNEYSEGVLKKMCVNIRRSLTNHFREEKVKEIISQADRELKFKRDEIADMKSFVSELCSKLEPYQIDQAIKDPAIVSHVNFDDEESISKVFKEIKKESDGTGILRLGWQGVNRMTQGGIRRGEAIGVAALQHNFKTGFTLNMFRQVAMYNEPVLIDPTKKPLLLHISFENEMETNLHLLYKYVKENLTGMEVPDEEINSKTEEELSKYIKENLQATGFHIEMLRVNPSMWTYLDLTNKLLEYEAEGYEIVVVFVDYLLMMPTTGCTQGAHGDDKRDMLRRTRNFCAARKAAFVTPFQISSDALMLLREDRKELVKQLVGKGYYDGCKRINQELDLELIIHKSTVNGKDYLDIARGKHRTIVKQTPKEDMFCSYMFDNIGAIGDDVNGADASLLKAGAGRRGSADEKPFWMEE